MTKYSDFLLQFIALFSITAECINGQKSVNCSVNHLDSTDTCTISCGESESCRRSVLNCRNDNSCAIQCNSKESCSDITINANNATDVTVICSSDESCTNEINILCGTGDCRLECHGSHSCVNLSYSLSTHTYTPIHNKPTANRLASSGFIIVVSIACCGIIIASSALTCLCFEQINNKEMKKIIAKVQSQSVATPPSIVVSDINTKESTDESYAKSFDLNTNNSAVTQSSHPLSYSHRDCLSIVNSEISSQTMRQYSTSIPSVDMPQRKQSISTNFSMLPLTTKRTDFEIRIKSNDSKEGNSEGLHAFTESVSVQV